MAEHRRLPIVGAVGPASANQAADLATRDTLREGGAAEVGKRALGWYEGALGDLVARLPPAAPFGCADGCAYCCHLKVIVSPPELVHLANHLRETLDETRLAEVRGRVRATDEKTRHLTADGRALLRVPCPLLENGRCIAYEARPLHCAGASSYDASQCRAAFEAPEREMPVVSYRPQAQLADVVSAGLSRGSFAEGRAGHMLELVAGLALVMDDPSRAERWDRGEDAFVEARDRELEAIIARSLAESPSD